MNPAGLQLLLLDARDSTWTALPGADTLVRLRVLTGAGEPARGARLTWMPEGTGSNLTDHAVVTDRDGYASARWRIGTDALERQSLRITVTGARMTREAVLRGQVIPAVVAGLRVLADTPFVTRLGDTLHLAITAVDPFGNLFEAPGLSVRVADSTIGRLLDGQLVTGARRGATTVSATSSGHELRAAVRVVQHVARLVPEADTLWVSSLGARRPLRYTVLDDRGRPVSDTAAALAVADTTIVELIDGDVLSRRTGYSAVHLTIGSVSAQAIIGVQQRVAWIGLAADTIRFDALLDTLTLHPVARDSLGSLIPHPSLVYETADAGVVSVIVGGTLLSVSPGSSGVTVRDPVSGTAVGAAVHVRQRVAAIDVADLQFDALRDTQPIVAIARDRLGSVVRDAALELTAADTGVAAIVGGARLRSNRPGATTVTARDADGVAASGAVVVAQRVVALVLGPDNLMSDALGDSIALAVDARDRLGSSVVEPALTYRSSDSAIVVATPDGRAVTTGNGSVVVYAQSPDGPVDSVALVVAQRVAGIAVQRDTVILTALNAEASVGARAVDRLGATVASATLGYQIADTAVAGVSALGTIRAVANGYTMATVSLAGESRTVAVRVAQRPYTIQVSSDTVRFDALGETYRVEGVVLDSLGSPIPDAAIDVAATDAGVVDRLDSLTLRAAANGTATASLSAGAATGSLVVQVDQAVASLAVAPEQGVISRPAGAPVPLACVARDRNGFVVDREALFVGSTRGTVSGIGCRSVRVERSGYDTLVFVLGTAEARVPVIVATSPDSVGITRAAAALPSNERIRYAGEDLSHPSILALRPLVQEILADYGFPASDLDRARALRDWVARTAIHPYPLLHPDGSTANASVLPVGVTWAQVNTLYSAKFFPDRDYWWSVGWDGYAMLDALLGTLDLATGLRANDGMMEHVSGSRYRIRDIQRYRYVLCTFQDIILNALWGAAGLQGMLLSTIGHDPAAVFIPELGRWVYQDPAYNEEYLLDGSGDPLSPLDLLGYSSSGQVARLRPTKMAGPSFDRRVYIADLTYLNDGHPQGMIIMGSQVDNRVVGRGTWPIRNVQIDVPQLQYEWPFGETAWYARVSAEEAFPTVGVGVAALAVDDSVHVVEVFSTASTYQRFERRLDGGVWESVTQHDVLPVGACEVEYRSFDDAGNVGATARLQVWAPRPSDWIISARTGSSRSKARYCVSTRIE